MMVNIHLYVHMMRFVALLGKIKKLGHSQVDQSHYQEKKMKEKKMTHGQGQTHPVIVHPTICSLLCPLFDLLGHHYFFADQLFLRGKNDQIFPNKSIDGCD